MKDTFNAEKYIEALNNMLGVDSAYFQGDKDVDALVELIKIANRQQAELDNYSHNIRRLTEANMRLRENNKAIMQTIADVRTEAIKEFGEKVVQTLKRLNLRELSGVGKEYDDIFYHQNPMAWTRGSTTARTEAIEVIDNLVKEMVGEDE